MRAAPHICRVGQNHTYMHGVYTVFFGREITGYKVMHGVYMILANPTQSVEQSKVK